MNRTKAVMLAFLIIILAIQFLQPARNKNGQAVSKDFSKVFTVPGNVQGILKKSCFDCHSNQTEYPWYTYIQPLGWWMNSHIRKGKEELNFSEFGSYSKRRQMSKLKSIGESIEDETMPLVPYPHSFSSYHSSSSSPQSTLAFLMASLAFSFRFPAIRK